MRRFIKVAGVILGLLALAAAGAGLYLRAQVSGSLPLLEGEAAVAGMKEPVQVEFDALAVPTLHAGSRTDLARATGFLHAQNRFFQMDLTRRQASGELAALLGPALVKTDTANRRHRFRDVARRALAAASGPDREILRAYAEGANAGLAALGSPPFEYLLLRARPGPWLPEDSFLIVLAMFLELNDEDGSGDSALGLLRDLMPGPLAEFLSPGGTSWDAPLSGGPIPDPPLPGPEVFDSRRRPAAPIARLASEDSDRPVAGSNNWAVAGGQTAHGGAILANDMHLGLSVPNIWYRASFDLPDPGEPGRRWRVTGVTLPGAPSMVAGSNGRVAWGFTNSHADWSDLVELDPDPSDPDRYMTPDGPRPFEHHSERIEVAGGESVSLDVISTIWGPVIDKDHRGRARALRWTAHDTEAVNMRLLGMETARGLDEALELAARAGIPAQNAVLADDRGRIAWTIMGAIPRRVGYDGRVPVSFADGSRRWDGYLAPQDYPRVVDPPGGRIWTANARVAQGKMLALLGDGGYDLGARAGQIRDDLMAIPRATERDMLQVQLDDRALFLSRWRDLLLLALTPEATAASPGRLEMRRHVEAWGGRASVDSVGYRLVRAFRSSMAEQILGSLTAECRKADPRFSIYELNQWEGPLWRLVSERPAHLLDAGHASWEAQILAGIDATLELMLKDGFTLRQRTWGQRNTVQVRHPISLGVPQLAPWLDMPPRQLPGDGNMPRVQSIGFGASERFVVSPGRESEGFFHMPCGQSGHPMSPHYGDGHAAWEGGEPTPFLPGPVKSRLVLTPLQ